MQVKINPDIAVIIAETPLPSRNINNAIKHIVEDGSEIIVKIATHYGHVELPISECWTQGNVLNLSVFTDKIETKPT